MGKNLLSLSHKNNPQKILSLNPIESFILLAVYWCSMAEEKTANIGRMVAKMAHFDPISRARKMDNVHQVKCFNEGLFSYKRVLEIEEMGWRVSGVCANRNAFYIKPK